jgi:hypothetical protein
MIDEPRMVQTTVQHTACIHITVPRDQIQTVMGPAYDELLRTLAAMGVSPTGPWLTHHLRMSPDVFDFEVAVPVAHPIAPSGRVYAGTLRATRVARTTYHGPYEGLGEAWGQFEAWIAEQGLKTALDLWEVYEAGPESSQDPTQWRTVLNHPLE